MKIVAAVIGFGIGKKHVDAIDSHKYSKVKTICEKNKQKSFAIEKKI